MFHAMRNRLRRERRRLKRGLALAASFWSPGSEVFGPPRRCCLDLAGWVDAQGAKDAAGAQFVPLRAAHAIERHLPGTIDAQPHWQFRQALRHDAPHTFVATLSEARVCGASGAVIAPGDTLLAEVSATFRRTPAEHPLLAKWRLPKARRLSGTTLALAAAGGQGFYHWLLDVLPRLELVEMAGIELAEIDTFLVNTAHCSFHQQAFELLGIPPTKVVELDLARHVRCERLIVPALVGVSGHPTRAACNYLRRELLGRQLPNGATMPTKPRIYLSRDRALRRKVVNEPQVVELLARHGFVRIFLEDWNLLEQAQLLAGADVVVAPHGAGLTNLAFCNPGTRVVELFAPTYINPCYWALANQAELDYYYLVGRGPQPPEFVDPHRSDDNLEVDLQQLAATLARAGVTATSSPRTEWTPMADAA